MELFPPLTHSLHLQLRDDAPLLDVALATHVLDLRQISNSGLAGEHGWPVWGTVCPGSHQPLRTKTILRIQAPRQNHPLLRRNCSKPGSSFRPCPAPGFTSLNTEAAPVKPCYVMTTLKSESSLSTIQHPNDHISTSTPASAPPKV
ncbi:Fer-1-like protein 4 [Lemmus lemmus]